MVAEEVVGVQELLLVFEAASHLLVWVHRKDTWRQGNFGHVDLRLVDEVTWIFRESLYGIEAVLSYSFVEGEEGGDLRRK